MRLKRIEIKNFRRIEYVDIKLTNTSFLIGPNNSGKTSILKAIEYLLSLDSIESNDFRIVGDSIQENIEITGYFGDISPTTASSRGFKGRIINGEFVYRKKYSLNSKKPVIESKVFPYEVNSQFSNAKKYKDLVDLGISEETIKEVFKLDEILEKDKLKTGWEKNLPEILDFKTDQPPIWEENPGGIPQNIISKLPKLISIPSFTNINDIESGDKKYILGECLSILFEDIITGSEIASNITAQLTSLEEKMNSENDPASVKIVVKEVNKIINEVFPNCGIDIVPSLQELSEILKPKYTVTLSSNIKTKPDRQGTGLIRTTAFAMLRYHSKLKQEKELQTRPIIVSFEEPEIYLHPSAANLLRETIYSLGKTDQIICTTHSPWMVDLSKDPLSLTRFFVKNNGFIDSINYSLSDTLDKMKSRDKQRIKMLQFFDDEISRIFFSERVLIVEGDTELLVLKKSINILPDKIKNNIIFKSQIIRARSKPTIISVIKYLKELGIEPYVMHDGDFTVRKAASYNIHIKNALQNDNKLFVLSNNLEQTLGYRSSKIDKPYKAYLKIRDWKKWTDIPKDWRVLLKKIYK